MNTDSTCFNQGLPFFFGRNVFAAIEGQNTPAAVGAYLAYWRYTVSLTLPIGLQKTAGTQPGLFSLNLFS
jgi:hypothetical protein